MIFAGQQISTMLHCPQCGNRVENRLPPASAFYMICCSVEGCSMGGIQLVIEKATNSVLWTSAVGGHYEGEKGWTPTFPMQADRDGNQVWPKKE